MRRSRYRSRLRKRPSGGRSRNVKKTGMNLLSVVVIIGLAVCLGFMTTKYVIYPILLGQEASFDVMLGKIGIGGDDDEKKNDKENNTEKTGDTGIFRMSPQTVDKAALGFVSQSHFSLIIRIVYKIEILCGSPSSRSPHFALIFASFLRFMQANVSPAFISIRAFPYICVYRNP